MNSNTLRHVPAELRDRAQWVAVKIVPSTTRPGKTDKLPVNPATGGNASTTDRRTWNTLDQAISRAERIGGAVGFVFSEDDPYCGLDLDDCIDINGNIASWARRIIERLDSYTERSLSGTGVHIIVRAVLPPGGRKRHPLEMYDAGRFFVFTGQAL